MWLINQSGDKSYPVSLSVGLHDSHIKWDTIIFVLVFPFTIFACCYKTKSTFKQKGTWIVLVVLVAPLWLLQSRLLKFMNILAENTNKFVLIYLEVFSHYPF